MPSSLFRRRPRLFRHMGHFEGVLGTSLEIQVVSDSKSSGPEAEREVLREIDRLDAVFNAYKPGSELRRWQETFEEDVVVSKELAQVLCDAERWRQWTGGAFNPAVEALTQLWSKHAQENIPVEQREIAEILGAIGRELWTVDNVRGTAFRETRLPVTLNAIAKGFIIDTACRVASEIDGVYEGLINIGGDIRHIGTKEVSIAIADPQDDAENAIPAGRIIMLNQGLATSGNYRRGFQIQERWYSHVLDPRSGWPVEEIVGVSVVAADAATADVLATSFNVLSPDESVRLADSLGTVGVLLIAADGKHISNALWKAFSR